LALHQIFRYQDYDIEKAEKSKKKKNTIKNKKSRFFIEKRKKFLSFKKKFYFYLKKATTMTTLNTLRFHYCSQDAAMRATREKWADTIMHTHRRQAACRPRGDVYIRLLMLEIDKVRT
jgi:hypothetical protein